MKMIVIFFCFLLKINFVFAQKEEGVFRMAFYNTENFYDYFDDTLTNDNDFTPRGMKGWNKKRYYHKCNQLFKVIAALNAEEPLIGLGLCEVENERVLRDLCIGTPLRNFHFDFVHFDSYDRRGIDVAFLYRKKYIRILQSAPIPFIFKGDSVPKSRDILYVKAMLMEKDTLHIFVNHFPSKFGGLLATQSKRLQAAQLLCSLVENIQAQDSSAFILAMGDFNDEPSDESLEIGLQCQRPWRGAPYVKGAIFNLMYPLEGKVGSHKYQAEWSLIDHFIVNGALMDTAASLHIVPHKTEVFSPAFLLMEDDNYQGDKVFRTFYGSKYLGGYSDHLPIICRIRQR